MPLHFQTDHQGWSRPRSSEVFRYFAMTCVCVGCGTEVKDKEGKPVKKLYDQVANQWKTSFNPFFGRPCWQTQTYWSYWSARSVDKCAIDTLRFHFLFDILLSSTHGSLPKDVAHRHLGLWHSGAAWPGSTKPSCLQTCPHQLRPCRNRIQAQIVLIFLSGFCNVCSCVLANSKMSIPPDWAWSQPLSMDIVDGFHPTLGANSLNRCVVAMSWNSCNA